MHYMLLINRYLVLIDHDYVWLYCFEINVLKNSKQITYNIIYFTKIEYYKSLMVVAIDFDFNCDVISIL